MIRASSAFGRKGAALVLAAGLCGCAAAPHRSPTAHGTSPSHLTRHSHGATRTAGGAGSATAEQAIALASRSTARVSSLALTELVTLRGVPAVAGVTSSASGALRLSLDERMRLRPRLLAQLTMHVNAAGKALALEEILTSSALYLRAPGLASAAERPWAKISLSALPNGMNLSKLFAQTASSGPLSQLGSPQALARLLTAAKHARVVRGQVVDGVPATEYSGVITPHGIVALMPAADRSLFGSLPPGLRFGGPVRIWIDGQHLLRRIQLRFSFRAVAMSVRINVPSINQPVTIVPPPASQVSPG